MDYAIKASGDVLYIKEFQDYIKERATKNKIYLFFGQGSQASKRLNKLGIKFSFEDGVRVIKDKDKEQEALEALLELSSKTMYELKHHIFKGYRIELMSSVRRGVGGIVNENADLFFKKHCSNGKFEKKRVCTLKERVEKKQEQFPKKEGYHVLGFLITK